jgi:hypothetical protein
MVRLMRGQELCAAGAINWHKVRRRERALKAGCIQDWLPHNNVLHP